MKRYAPAHKKPVLRLYNAAFRLDVRATCRCTEVPGRILRDWTLLAARLPVDQPSR